MLSSSSQEGKKKLSAAAGASIKTACKGLPSKRREKFLSLSPVVSPLFRCSSLAAGLGDLLQLHFLGKLAAEDLEVLDDIAAGVDDGLLGSDGAIGADAQLEAGEERVRHLVAGERDVLVLVQTRGQQVGERMVLLIEREDGSIGDTCNIDTAYSGVI